VTTVLTDELIVQRASIRVPYGVYAPREGSALLIDVLLATGRAPGSRVADLCSRSGVVALAAAVQGAALLRSTRIRARSPARGPTLRRPESTCGCIADPGRGSSNSSPSI
jgi:release factor glutamine methyltransferase